MGYGNVIGQYARRLSSGVNGVYQRAREFVAGSIEAMVSSPQQPVYAMAENRSPIYFARRTSNNQPKGKIGANGKRIPNVNPPRPPTKRSHLGRWLR
ncbi:MAG: hypothetical protein Q8R04_05115 [Nanoarchaeota archaeon]|nr:hypothetical protein [Nanoarchaeota archaeon]